MQSAAGIAGLLRLTIATSNAIGTLIAGRRCRCASRTSTPKPATRWRVKSMSPGITQTNCRATTCSAPENSAAPATGPGTPPAPAGRGLPSIVRPFRRSRNSTPYAASNCTRPDYTGAFRKAVARDSAGCLSRSVRSSTRAGNCGTQDSSFASGTATALAITRCVQAASARMHVAGGTRTCASTCYRFARPAPTILASILG